MSDNGTPPPPPPPLPPPGEPSSGPAGYPGMESMPVGPAPVPVQVSQPRSIAMAVKLMYVGAALSVLGILVTVLMRDSIRQAIEKSNSTASKKLTPSQIDAAVGVAVGFSVVVALIAVGLWLWMASANGSGKKWARIVATVLFGLNVVSILGGLINRPPALSLVASVVSLVLGGYIMYLLYRPESTAYYTAKSAPQY